jgi:hypothetical protein
VLLVAAIVAGYIFAWPLLKWRFHVLLATSLAEIQHSPAAVEKLGQPISIPLWPWPAGRVNSDGQKGNARFDFTVAGPKSKASAVSQLRQLDGKWDFTELKITCDDKTRIDVAETIEARDGNDTPKFDPNATQSEVKAPNMSVDITLPDLPPEPGK